MNAKDHMQSHDEIVELVKAAALQLKLLSLREYDDPGKNIHYVLDDNIVDIFLDPDSHIESDEDKRIGVGDVLPQLSIETRRQLTSQLAQHIFYTLSPDAPLLIAPSMEKNFAAMFRSKQNDAQKIARTEPDFTPAEKHNLKVLQNQALESGGVENLIKSLRRVVFLDSQPAKQLLRLSRLLKDRRLSPIDTLDADQEHGSLMRHLFRPLETVQDMIKFSVHQAEVVRGFQLIDYPGRPNRRTSLIDTIAWVILANERLRTLPPEDRDGIDRLVFLSLDSAVLNLGMALDAAGFDSDRESHNPGDFARFFIRHPRCLVGDSHVLGAHLRTSVLEGMELLLNPFFKERQDFKMQKGRVKLSKKQLRTLEQFSEVGTSVIEQAFAFEKEWAQYLEARSEGLSESLRTRFEKLLNQDDFKTESTNAAIKEIEKFAEDVEVQYKDYWRNVMDTGQQAFLYAHALLKSKNPPYQVVDIHIGNNKRIRQFIDLSKSFLDTDSDEKPNIGEFNTVVAYLRDEAHPYTRTVAYCYSLLLLSEFDAARTAAKAALDCAEASGGPELDSLAPNGREAHFLLGHILRFDAKDEGDFQICRDHISKADDILKAEQPDPADSMRQILTLRHECERQACNYSEHLTIDLLRPEESTPDPKSIFDALGKIVSECRNLQNHGEPGDSLSGILEGVFHRSLTGRVVIGLEHEELRDQAMADWHEWARIMNARADKPGFSQLKWIIMSLGPRMFEQNFSNPVDMFPGPEAHALFPYDAKRSERFRKMHEACINPSK